MAALEWIRFLAGAFFLLFGLGIFTVEMIGVFRFRYVLNRMHAAAMGDTLGIGFSLVGLMIMSGFNFTSLKLFLIITFLWFSSPASSHLIARLEVTTDEEPEKHYRKVSLKQLEQELHMRQTQADAQEGAQTAAMQEAAQAAAREGTQTAAMQEAAQAAGQKQTHEAVRGGSARRRAHGTVRETDREA